MERIDELKTEKEQAREEAAASLQKYYTLRFSPVCEHCYKQRQRAVDTIEGYIQQRAEIGGVGETETQDLRLILEEIDLDDIPGKSSLGLIETVRNILRYHHALTAAPQERGGVVWEDINRNIIGLMYQTDARRVFLKSVPPLTLEDVKLSAEILNGLHQFFQIEKTLSELRSNAQKALAVYRVRQNDFFRENERLERMNNRLES